MYTDQTPAFRSILTAAPRPPAKRDPPTRRHEPDATNREFLAEAYRIHNTLTALTTHLTLIKRAYLSPPGAARRPPPPAPPPQGGEDPERARLRYLERLPFLGEREKDEIDVRARLVIRGCKDRVEQLERREKLRQSKTPTTATLLSHLLPSLAPGPNARSALIAAHNAAIIWYLNSQLLALSERQRGMQEERARVREERGRSLGSLVDPTPGKAAAAATVSANMTIPFKPAPTSADDDLEPLTDISPAQLQQLSTENTHLLESMESTLSTIHEAERSLLEISALQTSLITHLASQTETIERLYDDAVDAVGSVGGANEQLREAKRSGRDARFFLLVFLVGASMALLFLDWYSS